MREIAVLDDAVGDMLQARDFYDDIEPGVGSYFLHRMWAGILALETSHGIHQVHYGLFRALSERFPFGIYYRETAIRTEVIAVLDLRQNPTAIARQLDRRHRS